MFVGDLIDRGMGSRAVLDRVRGLGAQAVVLRGNHEQMLLDFLDLPSPEWLRHGGAETLASFGIRDPLPDTATRDALRAALPPGMEEWLRGLPLWWQSGNLVVAHAGADPRQPMPHQAPRSLLWGHPAFGRFPRRDGLWVAHGHVIVPAARAQCGVISVDTGVYATGRLSCALISDAAMRFVQVRA